MEKYSLLLGFFFCSGIAELLECRIVVVTVTREQTSTNEIEPTRSAPETTLVIGLKGEAHFESLRPVNWEERLIQSNIF